MGCGLEWGGDVETVSKGMGPIETGISLGTLCVCVCGGAIRLGCLSAVAELKLIFNFKS